MDCWNRGYPETRQQEAMLFRDTQPQLRRLYLNREKSKALPACLDVQSCSRMLDQRGQNSCEENSSLFLSTDVY